MIVNIDSLIGKISATVASHKLEEGVYTRCLWENADPETVMRIVCGSA